ncbi:MAG: DNA alkylation repair protein [Candidatus Micrarchaeia archaeon]
MDAKQLVKHMEKKGTEKNREGMAKFGINIKNAYGVPVPELRFLARHIGTNQALSLNLWDTRVHEARILAAYLGDPKKVTDRQMDRWVADFDSWDVCDQVCGNLFDKTDFAHKKALEWSKRDKEFVKRAGFALMASLAVHDKRAGHAAFEKFFPAIVRESADGRNYVRKAVNWALRQIGKRSMTLNKRALEVCAQIEKIDSPSAKWVAADAKRELESERIQKRLKE